MPESSGSYFVFRPPWFTFRSADLSVLGALTRRGWKYWLVQVDTVAGSFFIHPKMNQHGADLLYLIRWTRVNPLDSEAV